MIARVNDLLLVSLPFEGGWDAHDLLELGVGDPLFPELGQPARLPISIHPSPGDKTIEISNPDRWTPDLDRPFDG